MNKSKCCWANICMKNEYDAEQARLSNYRVCSSCGKPCEVEDLRKPEEVLDHILQKTGMIPATPKKKPSERIEEIANETDKAPHTLSWHEKRVESIIRYLDEQHERGN